MVSARQIAFYMPPILPGAMYYDYPHSSSSERIYNVICTGSEAKLVDCNHYTGTDGSSDAVRVECQLSELSMH